MFEGFEIISCFCKTLPISKIDCQHVSVSVANISVPKTKRKRHKMREKIDIFSKVRYFYVRYKNNYIKSGNTYYFFMLSAKREKSRKEKKIFSVT